MTSANNMLAEQSNPKVFTFQQIGRKWSIGQSDFTALPTNGFKMKLHVGSRKNNKPGAIDTAVAVSDRCRANGLDSVCFTVVGDSKNKGAVCQLLLAYRDKLKNYATQFGPSVRLDNSKPQTYTFNLGSSFRMSPRNYWVRQIKFMVSSGNLPEGSAVDVTVKDLRFIPFEQVPRNRFIFAELSKRWERGKDNSFKKLESGFEMQMTAIEGRKPRSVQTACTINGAMVRGSDTLRFLVTGRAENRSAKLKLFLTMPDGSNRYAPKSFPLNSGKGLVYHLNFGKVFKFGEKPAASGQIKFQAESGVESAGHVTWIRVQDVAIISGKNSMTKGNRGND
jgi:hypothetical protein